MKYSITLAFLLYFAIGFAQQRNEIDLSGLDWKLSLDPKAGWQNEKLFLPGQAEVKNLPVNLPTDGWDALTKAEGKIVHLPATLEQYFWGYNGQTYGVTGNYVGVSWFTTSVEIPETMRGKRILLQIESVRFRAEIFVNEQLCGYDLVNSTPFEVDLTRAIQYGKSNRIAFRITDPNGNFNWKDSQVYNWGEYRTNPSHGFGGITGKVKIVETDNVFIDNVFVKNKPEVNTVNLNVTLSNQTEKETNGKLTISIKERNGAQREVYTTTHKINSLSKGETTKSFLIAVKNAKLWSVDDPNLYDLKVSWTGNESNDEYADRFGFRWFEIREVNGDKQFYLNGKRIVLRTSISWGFWPENGITPSDELARKQIESAKALGLNMLNFHRSIGQKSVLDYADELGLLIWEEPGGNQYPANDFNRTDEKGKMQADFYFTYRIEKLKRMMERDRNHPSLIIYNLHNERGAFPQKQDYDEMSEAHQLDETRILVYNSSNGDNPLDEPNARFKTHLLPYDTKFYDFGWWDLHHAGGPGVYHDKLYLGPDNYHRFSDHKSEIVYWGEEGAIGTAPRLQLIRDEIANSGKTSGWEAADYLEWYNAYDTFLKKNGFSKAFPTVDDLTRSMGNIALYYQGRVIENIRISNTVDGYAVNGWESMKLENHSGIVDNYRNPKGDPEVMARYCQPLFVSVKLNTKVTQVGDTATADFYIVNEKNIKGNFILQANYKTNDGKVLVSQAWKVKVTGGNVYGELLHSGWKLPVGTEGYSSVEAELFQNEKAITKGDDQIFAVKLDSKGISANGCIADTSGVLKRFLKSSGINGLSEYKSGTPAGGYMLVGAFEPQQWGSGMSDIMEWVYSGHTLVVVGNAARWAEFLADKEVLDYRGAKQLGKSWYGGNFFVREHPVFKGLPVDCAFNWEYQCFATYNKDRLGLRIFNGETVIGCVSDHKKEVYSAMTIIPAGRGRVMITSLDILSSIRDVANFNGAVDIDGMNESMRSFNNLKDNKANVVGQRLLLNLCKWAGEKKD